MTQPELSDDLITVTEIAEIAGTARPTVSNWKRRHSDFPQPKGKGERGPLFSRAEVLAWLESRDKLTAQPDQPRDADPARRLWVVAEPMLRNGKGVLAERLAGLLQALAGERAAHGDWRGDESVLGEVRDVAAQLSQAERASAATSILDELGRTKAGRDMVLPASLVDLMAGLLGPRSEVYDPATGFGRLLGACAAGGGAARLSGQAFQVETAHAAFRYLKLVGPSATMMVGDPLLDDKFADRQFDGIVANLPFGARYDSPELSAADPRWVLGQPSRASEDAWLQHVLYHLAPGGRAVVLVPASFLFAAGPLADRRTSLLRAGYLRAVVQLPAWTLPNTGMRTALLVLERPTEPPAMPHVLIAEPTLDSDGKGSAWSNDLVTAVITTVTKWLDGRRAHLSAEYADVDLVQLAAADFILDPRRLLAPAQVEVRSLDAIRHDLTQLAAASESAVDTISQSVTSISDDIPHQPTSASRTALRDLPGISITRGIKGSQLTKAGQFVVHTPNSLLDGRGHDRYLADDSELLQTVAPSFNALVGDLLVVLDGPHLGTVVHVTEPMFVSSQFAVIHPGADSPHTDYLAQWLRSSDAQAELQRLTTGTTLTRVAIKDLGRLPIPLPDPRTQSTLGALNRHLAEARDALQALHHHLAAISELAAEATTAALPTNTNGDAQ